MSERVTSTVTLKHGDVVQVAVELTNKATGMPYWWRRFAVVLGVANIRWVQLMTLKLHIDPTKDVREVDVGKDVVTLLPKEQWPQGVAALWMKLVHLGVIKLEGDD